MKENKITITLEDYSKAVDAVIEQMTLPMTSDFSKSLVKLIVCSVARRLWRYLTHQKEQKNDE